MRNSFLSEDLRERFSNFPKSIDQETVIQYFSLSKNDLKIIPKKCPVYSKLGFTLSLCALRWLGFVPKELDAIPPNAMSFILPQLKINRTPEDFSQYGVRAQSRSNHLSQIETYLGYRRITQEYQERLKVFLLSHAMEHDRPLLLMETTIMKLKRDKIIRPTLVSLERLVGSIRELTKQKTYELMTPLLSENLKEKLDKTLEVNEENGNTVLTWVRQRPDSCTPESILSILSKIDYLKQFGVQNWDLSMLNSNRLKFLTRLGRCSTNQALKRSMKEKRYPILIAFMHQSLAELIDEAIDLFDQCLSHAYTRSKNCLKRQHEKNQESTNEKIRLLKIIGSILLDNEISDSDLRDTLHEEVPFDLLRSKIDECDLLIRPKHDKGLDYLAKRFSYLRQFTPIFMTKLKFISVQYHNPVLQAIDVLKNMNATSSRKIPSDAPVQFIGDMWKPYVYCNEGKINRQYYEICVLWELRNGLRSGDIWVDGGRQYSNPEHYFIPKNQWHSIKDEACNVLQIPTTGDERLQIHQKEIEKLFTQLNDQISTDDNLKIEEERLVITPLEAEEEPETLKNLRDQISNRLPKVNLTDIILEVDDWVNFSECFHHAGNQNDNNSELPTYLYAALLSEATNIGASAMADSSDLSYDRIIWYKNWYIREETLEKARIKVVNFQNDQLFSQNFGDGKFSSSDGRRVPVAVKTNTAKAFVKYFGFETGLNLYSWTSDQFSQYGMS